MSQSMKQGPLFELLSRLSKKEENDFLDYLNSRLFNTNKNFPIFFTLYQDEVLKIKENKKEDILEVNFVALLKKRFQKDWSEGFYRKLKTGLKTEFKAFLIYQDWGLKKEYPKYYYFKSLNHKEWEDLIPKAYAEAIKEFKENEPLELDALRLKLQLYDEYNTYLSRQPRKTGETHLTTLQHLVNEVFVLEKLIFACSELNTLAVYKEELSAPIPGLALGLQMIQHWEGELPLLIKAYHINYLALVEPKNPAHYEALKRILKEEWTRLPKEGVRELYLGAINFAVRKWNGGMVTKEIALAEIQSFYDEMLKNDILLDKGKMDIALFKNIVRSLSSTEEGRKYARNFIEENGHKLKYNPKNKIVEYNIGVLCFYEKKFEAALSLFNQIWISPDFKFKDLFYELDFRVFFIKTKFEMGEVLESDLSAAKTYLSRVKNISKEHKEIYSLQFGYLYKMNKALEKEAGKKQRPLLKIKEEIQAHQRKANFAWFIKKINKHLEEENL